MTKYIKDCTRWMTDEEIEIWKKGEECYLKNWIGVKMRSKFERDGDNVTISYEEKEGEKVHKAICKFLDTKGYFDALCDDFIALIEMKNKIKARMMPSLIIFDEIDNYPEIANSDIHRRLMRIRTSTHEESYKK